MKLCSQKVFPTHDCRDFDSIITERFDPRSLLRSIGMNKVEEMFVHSLDYGLSLTAL